MRTRPILTASLLALSCALIVACTGVSTSTAPKAERRKADPELQAKREKLIDALMGEGVIREVKTPGRLPHLYVTRKFLLLDASEKQKIAEIICAWCWELPRDVTEEELDDLRVNMRIFDALSGKEIGTYSPGLGLSMH